MPDNQTDIALEAQNVTKIFGHKKLLPTAKKLMDEGLSKDDIFKETGCTTALCDVSFKVKQGEFFVIIGLSGSGKSTIIRCFNKLIEPTHGHVLFKGNTINDFSKKELTEFRRKKISMVFQSFGLFTHRSVLNNVAYGLEVRGIPKPEREAKAMEFIDLVGLSGLENSPIRELSGGMKQRVGLARALCNDPDVLLMDEPFSALDPLVRSSMQDELLEIQNTINKTTLFITHDINEAFKLGDRIAIMRDGRIIQTGSAEILLTNPEDDYVKKFVAGSDRSAIISAGMILEAPPFMADINNDEELLKAATEAREEGFPFVYLVDSHSQLMGIVPAEECKPGVKVESYPVTVNSTSLIKDILSISAEIPYPLPVVSSFKSVLLGVVSKSSLLKALKMK